MEKKIKKFNLVTLTVTEEGETLTGVHKGLVEDLNDEQIDRILDYMDKVAQIIAESVNELEEDI